MKESFYNHYLAQENIVLLYNSFRDAYSVLNKSVFDNIISDNGNIDIDKLKNTHSSTMNSLFENGFIVEDDVDEKALCENLKHNRRFSKGIYEVTINPTLDCNLKCWYCYENHKSKSSLSEENIQNIITHLRYKCRMEPFEFLKLNFFGGEPILKPKVIKEIISKIKELAREFEFKFSVHFTTNGTVIPKSLLEELNGLDVTFQITFDGNKSQHDTVRMRKILGDNSGTYQLILNNIKRIYNEIENVFVNIRINFSTETLAGLENIVDDLDFCDRKRVIISLHKVWQVDGASVDKSRLFEFIRYANSKLFIVNYMLFSNFNGSACYADNHNQALINFDGKVFKCTARDFNDENCEGILTKSGLIHWKTDKLMDRMNLRSPENCRDCKLLPSCPGICSQKRLESNGKSLCVLDKEFSMSEYIIHNFNKKLLEAKIKAS